MADCGILSRHPDRRKAMQSEHDPATKRPRVTRRRVLGAIGVGAIAATGGIVWSRREATIPVDPMPPGSKVIVIGAGAAGIGAVEKLTAAG